MKLCCNGFNLFGQLQVQAPIIYELTPVFQFEVINKIFINQTYSLLVTNDKSLIYYKKGVVDITSVIGKDFLKITCSDDRILFIDETKQVNIIELGNFMNKKIIYEKCVKDISIGSKITILYMLDGGLINVPQPLNFHCNRICDIKSGKEHCLLLDEEGNVYSMGAGSRGQLGHGKLDYESNPLLIEALAGIKIKKIATGGWHSCAVSQDGDLYVWGWNSNGQLGLGKKNDEAGYVSAMATPHVVDFFDDTLNCLLVSCGSRHTIIFLDNRQLYGCGWNKYHQLSKEDNENYYELTHLHNFENDNVLDLQCGPWNSAVLCK
ncbi:RCC1 domain-containing protein 1 [Diorhabda sublineata]|uniref:RCC1 domain-containing protein 1 n=1 Tax=Diorhabda sublineata TaxID=1163346 RepID=UPI0024E19350|nr:RCC1 domain-containing protein 1 [Diorhabda sublineata]